MPGLADLLPMMAMLAAVGALAGVLAGLLGVGGGIVLVPAFFYVFSGLGYGGPGVMQVALATSLATIVVTSARSVSAHARKGAVDWRVLGGWAGGIAIGALVAVPVVATLKSTVLMAIFGVLALAISAYLGFGRSEWRLRDTMPAGAMRWVFALPVGFLSVLMGIGGGSFGVPLMTLHGMPIHRAVATAAGFGAVIAVPSAAAFLLTPVANAPPWTIGSVNLPAFLVVIAMTLATAPLGARLAHALPARPLRKIFAVFLAIVALNMLRKAAGL